MSLKTLDPELLERLVIQIKKWSLTLGFQKTGISDINLSQAELLLENWLKNNFQGDMDYMSKHGTKRSRPDELEPGTLRVISVRMDYFPAPSKEPWSVLNDASLGYVSRYALGRDYHKVIRKKLQRLASLIEGYEPELKYRVFVDSAPVLEKALAEKAGLGWIGKHSNLLSREAGSWFFLGEIYINLPLPIDNDVSSHCGKCTSCIDDCPTKAIVAPYQVDARRCISYLTIENKKSIPVEFRKPMGNRIYGCDDCQLVCPWNKFSEASSETDYSVRHSLDCENLLTLFQWDEETFLKNTEGSPIRRIGYSSWIRNIAVALGNSPYSSKVINTLNSKKNTLGEMVDEHISWAIEQQEMKSG
ncbi:MAG: tRNA epoxyqueuosine(34) reductase QueG [Gammaproteobacteria bacterium]|nr:tRNA epoxyqueuosine(34) reductase QueG [Gammaproteobacteria bacterium]